MDTPVVMINNKYVPEIHTLTQKGQTHIAIADLLAQRGVVGPSGKPLTDGHISALMIANGFRKVVRSKKVFVETPLNHDTFSDIADIAKSNLPEHLKVASLKALVKSL